MLHLCGYRTDNLGCDTHTCAINITLLSVEMSVSEEVDPTFYLKLGFTPQGPYHALKEFPLVHLHRFFAQKRFTSNEGELLRVLDYGCGPVVAYDISAAGLNAEIVLAEYRAEYRSALNEWLNESATAWDWSPYIKYVVQNVEEGDEKEATEREERLRKAIKAVVACDITQDPPIAEGYEGPYDVVMSMLCIENACITQDEYKAAVKTIAALVKKGGNLVLYSTVRNRGEHDQTPGYYFIRESKYVQVALPMKFVLKTLEENGFTVVETNILPEEATATFNSLGMTDMETAAFIIAAKS